MKNAKFIKLLALMLCVVMMFASCSSGTAGVGGSDAMSNQGPFLDDETAGGEEGGGEEGPAEEAPTLEDFLEINKLDKTVITEALKMEGDIYDQQGVVVIFRSTELDTSNNVKETFSVYSMLLNKVVMTFENSYEYTTAYQPKELDVSIVGSYVASIIKVTTTTRTPLSEEDMAGNFRFDEANPYKVETSVEYFDMSGNLVDTDKNGNKPAAVYPLGDSYTSGFVAVIGTKVHYFDVLGNLERSADLETSTLLSNYDYETDKYFYFFNVDVLGEYESCVQVFDKETGALVLQYVKESVSRFGEHVETSVFVLDNGNLLVQKFTFLEENGADYDLVFDGEKCNMTTFIVDVETGAETAVETNYVFFEVLSKSYITKQMELMETLGYRMGNYETVYTDKLINYAFCAEIQNKQINFSEMDTELLTVFFNNEFEISLVTDETESYSSFCRFLSDGTLVYEFSERDEYQIYLLIHEDGTKTYLDAGKVELYDSYIVTDDHIYDLDFNVVFDFTADDEDDYEYMFHGIVGDNIILSLQHKRVVDYTDPIDEEEDPEPIYEYYFTFHTITKNVIAGTDGAPDKVTYSLTDLNNKLEIDLDENASEYELDIWDLEDIIIDVTEDYIYVLDENGKYTLYNANLEHVLTTSYECEIEFIAGSYVMVYEGYSELIVYTLK